MQSQHPASEPGLADRALAELLLPGRSRRGHQEKPRALRCRSDHSHSRAKPMASGSLPGTQVLYQEDSLHRPDPHSRLFSTPLQAFSKEDGGWWEDVLSSLV